MYISGKVVLCRNSLYLVSLATRICIWSKEWPEMRITLNSKKKNHYLNFNKYIFFPTANHTFITQTVVVLNTRKMVISHNLFILNNRMGRLHLLLENKCGHCIKYINYTHTNPFKKANNVNQTGIHMSCCIKFNFHKNLLFGNLC